MSARAILGEAFASAILGQDAEGIALADARAAGAAELRERVRVIVTAPEAINRFRQAATLALETELTVEEARAVLAICATDEKAAEVPGLEITDADAAAAWINHLRRPQ